MEQELQKRITKVTKNQEATMSEKTGVESSLDEEEVRKYFYEVLDETKRRAKK